MNGLSTCPYCLVALAKFPGKKTKCPACGKYMYVRTDPHTKVKILLTEKKVLIHDWLKRMPDYGISRETYENARLNNPSQTEEQTIVSLLDWRAKHPRKDAFDSPFFLYSSISQIIYEGGGDPTVYLRKAARAELRQQKKIGITEVQILASSDSCPSCQEMNGKTFPIEEALKTMPLPHRGCTKILSDLERPYCRCIWVMATTETGG